MAWLRKMFTPPPAPPDHLAPHESIKPQLAREMEKRKIEHDRTDGFARLLNDYRAQDGAIRR